MKYEGEDGNGRIGGWCDGNMVKGACTVCGVLKIGDERACS